MRIFFNKYPEILQSCRRVNQSLGELIILESDMVINFDLILPFLLPNLTYDEAFIMSKEMRVHREIVDIYNKETNDNELLGKLTKATKLIRPISIEEYRQINETTRKFNGSLTESYILSTDRVYYRNEILKQFSCNNEIILGIVRNISAFLLFEDDVYDLSEDFSFNKETILTGFLSVGNDLSLAIDNMLSLIGDSQDYGELSVLRDFMLQFSKVFSDDTK